MSCASCNSGFSSRSHSHKKSHSSRRHHRRERSNSDPIASNPPISQWKPKLTVVPPKQIVVQPKYQFSTYYTQLQPSAGSTASGRAEVHLNSAGTQISYTIFVRDITGQIQNASFVSGSIQNRNVMSIAANPFFYNGGYWVSRGTIPVTAGQSQMLSSQQWVVVVTSNHYPLGELRGHLMPVVL